MEPILKIALFFIFFFSIAIGGYKAYKYCNEKITGSSNGWKVLAFPVAYCHQPFFIFRWSLHVHKCIYFFERIRFGNSIL